MQGILIQYLKVLGYGVIGSPADSGSACLGSSPGTPARFFNIYSFKCTAPSSSGLGLWLLKPATRVRIPSELQAFNYFLANACDNLFAVATTAAACIRPG